MSGVHASTDPNIDLRWPAERFYMARLDLSAIPRGMRLNDDALRYLFEAELPIPLSEVHAVFVKCGARQVLAIGCEKSLLREAIRDFDPIRLGPTTIPQWLEVAIDPGPLNLLVGEFLPAAVRASRRSMLGEGLLCAALAAALFLVGIERRARADLDYAELLSEQHAAVLSSVLGPPVGNMPAGQRRLALTGELRRQREAIRLKTTTPSHDAAEILTDVLARWPGDLQLRTLAVGEDSVAITATTSDAAKAEDAARSLAKLAQFELASPQVVADGAEVAVTLRLDRSKTEGKR